MGRWVPTLPSSFSHHRICGMVDFFFLPLVWPLNSCNYQITCDLVIPIRMKHLKCIYLDIIVSLFGPQRERINSFLNHSSEFRVKISKILIWILQYETFGNIQVVLFLYNLLKITRDHGRKWTTLYTSCKRSPLGFHWWEKSILSHST